MTWGAMGLCAVLACVLWAVHGVHGVIVRGWDDD